MSISPDDPQPFEDEFEDEYDPNHYRDIILKWIADGAETIEEVAERLEAEAARLRRHAADGWFLTEPIDGGRGTLDLSPEAEARGVLRPSQNPDDPERWVEG